MDVPGARSPRIRPEYVFATLLALFGTVFALGVPPCQTPDEPSHFFRAYRVSQGKLSVHKKGEWPGTAVPVNIARIADTFNELPFHPERHTSFGTVARLWSLPLEPHSRRYCLMPGSGYYSFVPYVPQAVGMAAARRLGCGPLQIFYAGRLANLALAVVLVFWTVRLTPVFPLVFGMIALLPISVHQFASQNPDASTMAVALLLLAILLRLALRGPEQAPMRLVSGFVVLSGWLTLCKFPYAGLALLYLAVPWRRVGGFRRYALVGACVLVIASALTAAMTQLKKNVPDRLTMNPDMSISKQVEEIRSRPLRYAKVVLATLAEHGGDYFYNLGSLGWLDTRVNPLAMEFFLAFLVIVALADRTAGIYPSAWVKLTGLIAAGLCTVVILTSCYVCGCLYKAKIIVGPQPRYFVPLLPLLLLPLYNSLVRVQVDRRALLALCAAACSAVQLVAVTSFMRRYYYPVGDQLHWSPVSLALACALFLAVWTWAQRRYGSRRSAALRLLTDDELTPSGFSAPSTVKAWSLTYDADTGSCMTADGDAGGSTSTSGNSRRLHEE